MLCSLVYRKAAAWFWTNVEQKFLCFEDSAYILVSRSAEVSFCCKKIYHFNNTNLQLSTAPLSYLCCSPAVNGNSYLARIASQYCEGWHWAVCAVGAQTVWEAAKRTKHLSNQVKLNTLDAKWHSGLSGLRARRLIKHSYESQTTGVFVHTRLQQAEGRPVRRVSLFETDTGELLFSGLTPNLPLMDRPPNSRLL